MALPHNAAIPAVDSRRCVLAHVAGRRIVEMVQRGRAISQILTRAGVRERHPRQRRASAARPTPVIHLLAHRRPRRRPLTLDDWDRLGRDVPTLVDLMPSGRFLMEDFYYAGGLPAVMRALAEHGLLHRDALTVNGKTIWRELSPRRRTGTPRSSGRSTSRCVAHGGIAVLRGNLAPDGAVLKPSAASPRLMKHRGRAVVFENIEDYNARIDDPELDVDADCVLVLKNCGPKGYPGMAEVGNMGLPPKLLQAGITDMVRISDARMSGTAYGTVVLHVAPEAAVGGPLALVRDGDIIELDVEARRLHLDVTDEELARRRAGWTAPPPPGVSGGYRSSTSITCCRPTAAPISISCWAAAATRCRENRIRRETSGIRFPRLLRWLRLIN